MLFRLANAGNWGHDAVVVVVDDDDDDDDDVMMQPVYTSVASIIRISRYRHPKKKSPTSPNQSSPLSPSYVFVFTAGLFVCDS